MKELKNYINLSNAQWFGKQTNIQLDYLNRIVTLIRSESNTYFHCKIRS